MALSYFGLALETPGAGKSALSATLVQRCAAIEALEALCDVIVMLRPNADERVDQFRRRPLENTEPLRAGSMLGRYRLEREIGTGPLGTVFAAKEHSAWLRLKLLNSSVRDRAKVERFFARTRG
ncbi:MAG TPA: hypothetical protein VGP93_08980, partial [Polyangiaceae bacterium]|nr:hypothetical protein [Polyangiaceae bacterium]